MLPEERYAPPVLWEEMGEGSEVNETDERMKEKKKRGNRTRMFLMLRRFKLGEVTHAMCKHGNALASVMGNKKNWTHEHASVFLYT